jgi:hypothetical protein
MKISPPRTLVGENGSAGTVPSPITFAAYRPQQYGPCDVIPHTASAPGLTAVNASPPLTRTGDICGETPLPIPTCPRSFRPQQYRIPPADATPHVVRKPARRVPPPWYTVTTVCPVDVADSNFTVADPTATPVTRPLLSTVATDELLDDHFAPADPTADSRRTLVPTGSDGATGETPISSRGATGCSSQAVTITPAHTTAIGSSHSLRVWFITGLASLVVANIALSRSRPTSYRSTKLTASTPVFRAHIRTAV